MKKVIISLMVVSMCSCISTGGRKIEYKYPSDIEGMCKSERDSARACIQSTGTKISERSSVKVVKIDGTKKINGYWCWQSPEWQGMWVAGLTRHVSDGYQVEVGCNPKTKQEISPAVVKHEHGHFWCMSNGDMSDHNPKYRTCFFNWNAVRGDGLGSFYDEKRKVMVDVIIEE